MDSFVDALLLQVHSLDEYLHENYGFVADYLPERLVTTLSPYMNERMCVVELKKQLPRMLAQTILVTFAICSVSFYFFLWCYRYFSKRFGVETEEEEEEEEEEDHSTCSKSGDSDETTSSEEDDDTEEETISDNNEAQESTA